MKIEAVKNQQIENKESKNVYKTESSIFSSPNTLKPAEIAPSPTSGAFAKILEETRKENGKNNAASAKNADGEHDTKAASSEKDEKINRQTDEKKKLDDARKQLERQHLASLSVTQPRTKKMLAPQPLDRATMDLPPGTDPRTRLVAWMSDPTNE